MAHGLSHPRGVVALVAVALLTGWGGAPARAVDGVIEINQARALAGGVTPSDTPGFPVTIDTPGSYRLTGNLTVPDANTTAILVTTDRVRIDLNGFGILGPEGAGAGRGVNALNKQNITVTNGIVSGFGGIGIIVGANARVDHVRALSNGGNGITADSGTVSGNTAKGNGAAGISGGGSSTVSGNTAQSNGNVGIAAAPGSTVSGNTAGNNTSFGLFLGAGTGYAKNILSNNNGGNANPQVSGGIRIGTNVCGFDTICP